MAETLGPRESAQLISKKSQHAFISAEGIDILSANLFKKMKENKSYMDFKRWKTHQLNPQVCDEAAVDWIFLIDALNFSFWSVEGKEKYNINYKGGTYTGYWSLCAAINRAIDQGIPITSAEYCKDFNLDQAHSVFQSDSTTTMPLLEERVKVMNEIGAVLVEKFNGKFTNCIKQAEGSAQKLLSLIVENFPCFRDEGIFEGCRVSFYKRAQILVADLWACFEGDDVGKFSDIDSITMFADYRIPQILVYFNVINYSNELMTLLKDNHMFQTGDKMEMEIRAASIWAIELLVERINEMISQDNTTDVQPVNAIILDHFLWDYRRQHDSETKHIPFHKIRCMYY